MQEAPHSSQHAVMCGKGTVIVCSHRVGTGTGANVMPEFSHYRGTVGYGLVQTQRETH